jgi:hypothetical protein
MRPELDPEPIPDGFTLLNLFRLQLGKKRVMSRRSPMVLSKADLKAFDLSQRHFLSSSISKL